MSIAEPIPPPSSFRRRPADRNSFVAGLVLALAINGGGALTLYLLHRHGGSSNKKVNEVFVDVKLLKFGKKRDTSFLPHVESAPRVSDQRKIKVTDNPDKPKDRPKDQPKPDLSKLFDQVKNMRVDDDDRVTKEATEEGDPRGIRGGTANEAAGDPYIQAIVAAVVERWTVPTMLTPGELAKLQAAACLKIDDSGKLVEFKITEPSGNSLFDGSLLATLGSIKELPKPQGRFAGAARAGKLCPFFAKQ
jgi:hypothetical protein